MVVRGRYLHGGTSEQVGALVDEVLATLDGGNPWGDLDCGEVAEFFFAPTSLTEDTFAEPPFDWAADHQLTVAVNRLTGFGALRWDTRSVSVNDAPRGSTVAMSARDQASAYCDRLRGVTDMRRHGHGDDRLCVTRVGLAGR